MSIRLQLLLVALTTLILPWAGCQYARELEHTLRVSQESSLQASADTIGHALSADSERVFRNLDVQPFDASREDLYVFPLHNLPLLDGYREDWNLAAEPAALPFVGLGGRMLAGFTDRYLFLFLEIDDPRFDPEPSDAQPATGGFDRVDLVFGWPDGAIERYFFATSAPGLIEAQVIEARDGGSRIASEPRIQAFWLQTSRGYRLEARIPRSLVGTRLWVQATDGAGGGTAGLMGSATQPGGRLFFATPGLDALLATFIGHGTRATVVDANGLKLGSAGSLVRGTALSDESDGSWYRRFVAGDTSQWPLESAAPERLQGLTVSNALAGRPSAQWLRGAMNQEPILAAAAPLTVDNLTRGAVVLEQAGDQLLDLRDRALTRLFDLTLLATALAAAVAFGIATWISVRIGRLTQAAETAVAPDGRILLVMPESLRRDEIGTLARGFERLLGRLNEHAQYLRTLGGKLSHELRTPLTIVRSSLDNLESEGVRPDQQGYVTRARDGIQRLQSILSALGAAARVEESIRQSDRASFDLNALLQSAISGYRNGFPQARIELDAPAEACFTSGAPDLIVQMLDKLIENAVDFCTMPGTIVVRLCRSTGNYELSVANDGPTIPDEVRDRLFESLFEQRRGRDDTPHFGLGLYIVRLIAEFHGGRASVANRPDDTGVIFTILLPMI